MAFVYVAHRGAVVTRADAKAAGLTRWFSGKPCKHGHLSERTTCNGACIACNRLANEALYKAEGPDGRAVRNERSKAWNAAHREERRAYGRAYSKANREKGNAWKAANREKLNAAEREARKRNPEAVKARVRRYLATDKAKVLACVYATRRRALKLEAEGSYTAEDVKRIGAAQKWRCHWCKASVKDAYEVDHIQPLSKGGSNWPNNLCIACMPCNRRKSALDPVAFAQRLGLLL